MTQIRFFLEGFLKQFGRASELSTENCVTRFKCFAYRRKEKLKNIFLQLHYTKFTEFSRVLKLPFLKLSWYTKIPEPNQRKPKRNEMQLSTATKFTN